MTVSELINKVKVKIDEVSVFDDGSFISSGPTEVKPISAYIEGALEDSCNEVLSSIPLYLIESESFLDATMVVTSSETGYIILPSDYLRLSELQMCTWEREVIVPLSKENPKYFQQKNKWTRGTPYQPECVEAYNEDPVTEQLVKTLEYYSIAWYTTAKKMKARYIQRFNENAIQDSLADYYSLQCGINVLDIMGSNLADVLRKEYTEKLTPKAR